MKCKREFWLKEPGRLISPQDKKTRDKMVKTPNTCRNCSTEDTVEVETTKLVHENEWKWLQDNK